MTPPEQIRQFSRRARAAYNPDQIDEAAQEYLSQGAQDAVRVWTDMWRKRIAKDGVCLRLVEPGLPFEGEP